MTKYKLRVLFLLTLLLSYSSQSAAEEFEHEEHAAHVHGEAELLIALEGNTLEIEFLSPAMNIVGFEHQPANQVQSDAIESALVTMKDHSRMFSFPAAAQCSPVSLEVVSPFVERDEHTHADEDTHHHEEETHGDFSAHYRFHCARMSRLDSIVIGIFKQFPGTGIIKVQSISNRGQQSMELNPEHNTLGL